MRTAPAVTSLRLLRTRLVDAWSIKDDTRRTVFLSEFLKIRSYLAAGLALSIAILATLAASVMGLPGMAQIVLFFLLFYAVVRLMAYAIDRLDEWCHAQLAAATADRPLLEAARRRRQLTRLSSARKDPPDRPRM